MNIKKHLFKIATLSVAFTLGIGLATHANTAHEEVDATQYIGNYDSYTYSGNYYNNFDFAAAGGMNGALRTALTSWIKPKGFFTYSGSGTGTLSEELQEADQDPNNSNNMVIFYTRDSIGKAAAGSGTSMVWNREHVWCQSLSNGNWGESQGGTDLLHLRPDYASTNSSRSNTPYGDINKSNPKYYDPVQKKVVNDSSKMLFGYSNGTWFEPLDCVKGDVARIVMYIWTTYTGWSGYSALNITSVFQSYDTLLKWHTMDRPDALEGHRNDYVQSTKQKNRNPFVDHPELAWKIFNDANGLSTSVLNQCMAAYPANGGDPVNPTGISLNRTTATISVDTTTQLTATIQPNGATGTVTWSSDDTNVATVSNSGLVRGISEGTATITASVAGFSASCEVTVTDNGGGSSEEYTKVASYLFESVSSDSEYTSGSALLSRFNSSVQSGTGLSNIVTSITSVSKVYAGYGNYKQLGIKFGTSSSNGSFTASLDTEVSRVIVKTAGWETSDSITIGDAASQTPGVAYTAADPIKTLTFDITASSTITFAYAKRGFIQSIDFYSAGEAADNPRNHLNNAMQVSYLTADENSTGTGSSTESITFASLGLSNGEKYSDPFEIADGVTITFAGGAHDGKYYTTGSGIRTYSGGSIIIASTSTIFKIVFTWSGSSYKPTSDVANPTGYNYQTNTWTGSASSVTLTRPSASDHWRLQAVQVTYETQSITVNNVKMRFGAAIPVEDWYDIEASWDVDYYGVMFLKYDTLHNTHGYSSIEEAYEDGIRPRADVHTNEGDMPLPLDGLLIFTARINMTSELNYGVVYVAAPYMVIDGTHYFLEEMEYSVNSMAQEYLDNDLDSTLSNAALTKLATPTSQGD